jgi:hypothetical protein
VRFAPRVAGRCGADVFEDSFCNISRFFFPQLLQRLMDVMLFSTVRYFQVEPDASVIEG